MTKKTKLWGGRFSEETNALVDAFNASIGFDFQLARHDIAGSEAHAKVLHKAGVLTKGELNKILSGLKKVAKDLSRAPSASDSGAEDIHMLVEAKLTAIIGPLGGKLHTGRSRNDQVALDIRLYLKDETETILKLIDALEGTILSIADGNINAIMPGYTHLQRAQPVLFAHHMIAYFDMLERDAGRFRDTYQRADLMPLGAGALAGSPYKLDRKYAAKLLGFAGITKNSMDSVSDRDFVLEFLSSASILMIHLSRLSEELILWSSSEFAFIEFSDAFSTGSSIMPQKKNPDVAELIRGKTGRVFGNLSALLMTMKGLPLAYNKDMQEDKEPLFDTVATIKTVLAVLPPMLATMKVNAQTMLRATKQGFLTATDAADYLVAKGLPFRESHALIGKAVRYSIENKKTLEELSLDEWKKFSPLFEDDIRTVVQVSSSIKSRKVSGGTSPGEVKKRLREIRAARAKKR